MSEAILVLNAGSSSLKFSVHNVTGDELRVVGQGQVEGLGTSPRFRARDAGGAAPVCVPCTMVAAWIRP